MSWLKRSFRRRELFRDISEEIRQHLGERTDELVEAGLSRDRAAAQARREFGNVTSLEESSRETWQWPRIESFLADIRYALRQLRAHPSFSVVAILILAIGIGANVAVFSVVDTLVLEPLPFRNPDRMVWIINFDTPGLSGRTHRVSTFEALAQMQSLEEITTYEAFFARSSYKLTGDREPDRVAGVMVPDNFFPFLGVTPALGRTFAKEEMDQNGPGAVILSHGLWERRYSSDPNVVGRELIVNDRPSTIVGVMPRSFDFGEVFAPGINIEVYMPVPFDVVRNWGNTMAILGRLKPGMTIEAAQSEASALVERQQRERPDLGGVGDYNAIVKPFRESVVGNVRQPMLILWAAVGLVLLIVCVNLSNLLLARAATRSKEIALRSAIGAGRFRLARQLLTESFVLSLIGGGLGVGLAYAAVGYVRSLEGLSIPLLKNVQISGGVLVVALSVAVLTAILFGLAPAVAVVKGDLGSALKESGRGTSESRDHRFVRAGLVVSEVALACLLLIGAGLLLRSFLHVLDVNLGFEPEQTYSLRIDASNDIDSQEEFTGYMRRIMEAANSVPGVEASVTDAVPLDSNRSWTLRRKDRVDGKGYVGALVKVIGPGLMKTLRTPIVRGREFVETDDQTREPVVLINQTLAARLWPSEDPIGQQLAIGDFTPRVVGIVADVRHLSVEESAGPEFYVSIFQVGTQSPSLVVRASRPFSDVAPPLRRALTDVVPDLPTAGFKPLDQVVDRALSGRRFFVNLLMAFAAAALLLAAIGIYGVIAYSVTRRTAEIGIRMALGATASGVRIGVVGDTLRLTFIGIAAGLVGAGALSSLMTSLLYDVSPSDPWTFGAAAGVLLLVAATAGLIPAARASRISPISALRAD